MFQNENEFILISMQCCYCIAKPRHGNICKKSNTSLTDTVIFTQTGFFSQKEKSLQPCKQWLSVPNGFFSKMEDDFP